MPRGITLVRGSVVVLSLDGTLVYVEDVAATFAAVVALPEQPVEREAERVFTPGKVGAKKISPYSTFDREVVIKDLSERNREFIGTYEKLRADKGPNYVQRTPAEEAAMSVTKITPVRGAARNADPDAKRAAKQAKRQAKRAAKTPCATCGLLMVHASHQSGGSCTYAAPARKTRRIAPDASGQPDQTAPTRTGRQPRAAASAARYVVVSNDLTTVQAASDKFKDGNRFWRVFRALDTLPEHAGTLEQIIAAVVGDGGRAMTNAEKVVRRALKQLQDAGNVTR